MNAVFIHVGYFFVLIMLSFLSFYMIFGAGFAGNINMVVLFIPFVFSVLWVSGYAWSFRRLAFGRDAKRHSFPLKNWVFVSLYLAGIFSVYSLFLSTLFPTPIENAPPWMFLGTPFVLLLLWYWLFSRYVKNTHQYKQTQQQAMSSVLFMLSFLYTYGICSFYFNQFL